MSRKALSILTGLVLTFGAASAFAAGPVTLTSSQMDNVTAGNLALSLALAGATANGLVASGTFTQTGTTANTGVIGASSSAGSVSFSGAI
jgi:hypothetical protein